jgi:chromatin structure-remodeling complex subunit RSC9
MAPPPRTARDFANPSPEEYRDFIAKLSAYHEKRGTPFDPEPKAGSKHVNLLQLYKTVLEGGGYDHVSEKKLEWRKLAQDFNLGSSNIAAMGFSLKTVYYKYLAAYEISTVYGKEPPPREILEDTTARGAALLSRTVDNFQPRISNTAMGADQYESGDEGTPVREQNGNEDAPGSGGRVTRGLRQAPPQRILFQPDTQPSRHSTRHPSGTSQPHHVQYRGASTSHNPQSNLENQSYIVTNYEPRPQMPLTLRPVITPGYNAAEWARLQRAVAAANTGAKPQPPRIMLPGSKY